MADTPDTLVPLPGIIQEFVDLWVGWAEREDFDTLNSLLARNMDFDVLKAFAEAGPRMSSDPQASNLLAVGYLIRLLEERIG